MKFMTALNIACFLHSGFFSNLRLPWKTDGALKCFTVLNIFFIIQDFWATCACPEKQSVRWNFSLDWIYFTFRIFVQLALALKTEFALKIFKPGVWPPSPTTRFVCLCIRLLTLGTLWDVLWVNATEEFYCQIVGLLYLYTIFVWYTQAPEATFPCAMVGGV